MKVASFGKVVKGKDHKVCEDAILLDKQRKLFGVADGVTVPAGGKEAAEKSLKYLKKFWKGDMIEAIKKSNEKIIDDRAKKFVGYTTLVAVKIEEGMLKVASIGDSPAYIVFSGRMIPIGSLDRIFGTHALAQAIGEENINIHYSEEKIGSGNYVILMSDGITDVLSKEEILHVFSKEKKVDAISKRLLKHAEAKPTIYNDDKSIIVIQIL
jgi:serine/threonine protein phosphatase PrpC